jgi:hypothetical protein
VTKGLAVSSQLPLTLLFSSGIFLKKQQICETGRLGSPQKFSSKFLLDCLEPTTSLFEWVRRFYALDSCHFDSLCGLVVRLPGYRSRGPSSILRYQIFGEVVGLERVHSAS